MKYKKIGRRPCTAAKVQGLRPKLLITHRLPHLTPLRFVKMGFPQVKHLRCFFESGGFGADKARRCTVNLIMTQKSR